MNIRSSEYRVSKTLYFIAASTLGLSSIVALFIADARWLEHATLWQKLVDHNRFFADVFLCVGMSVLLYSKHWILRSISYLTILVASFGFLSQYMAFLYTETFVPLIALENIQLVGVIDYGPAVWAAVIWLTVFTLCVYILEKSRRAHARFRTRVGLALVCLLISGVFINDRKWLPIELDGNRYIHYRNGHHKFPHKSPLNEFAAVLKDHYDNNRRLGTLAKNGHKLDAVEQDFVDKHGIKWGLEDPIYPLIKSTSTQATVGIVEKPDSPQIQPNLIVIFAEGLSARLIQPYGRKFPGLSPNIERFAQQSTVIDRHYNHTFATYRGLSGAHCSMFPTHSMLEEVNYRCFTHILNENGYHTKFLYSQQRDLSHLDEIFSKVGIAEVKAFEELVAGVKQQRGLDPAQPYPHRYLTDADLMRSLITELESAELQSSKPFYLGLYNFETHTRFKLLEPQSQYTANGQIKPNNILDTVHNLDIAFGEFWDYFRESPYFENTIVVLTSDHARYPDRDYMDMWDPSDLYQPVFVDKIPLIIYSPKHDLVPSHEFDASSSLDLAPSLLHLLGINQYRSAFLGESIFQPHKTVRMAPVAMGGKDMWYVAGGSLARLNGSEDNPNYQKMADLINRTRVLERSDQIWPRKTEASSHPP